eukprot:TRINITY_DN7697_c0_g1_i3.p1 TRINITY_DN7697_c0_g1~~TRINITY_DN7697_c0_g1_i3.p1  ORF type:complete len:229 (+),score=23.78 TRINITY_DN7697_c0_g1_i3:122-808(+)
MLFLSWWRRPNADDQRACLQHAKSFNYDTEFQNLTASFPLSNEEHQLLVKAGYTINQLRCKIGSGRPTYEKAKQLLKNWRHFQLKWAFVESRTCVKPAERFCVCTRELCSWLLMPLEILYVNDYGTCSSNEISKSHLSSPSRGLKNSIADSRLKSVYRFGSGTLQGHLFAGEEMFSLELDANDDVWYGIFSFSRPAHFLSSVGKPYVHFKQKLFTDQSLQAVVKGLSE